MADLSLSTRKIPLTPVNATKPAAHTESM